MEWMFKACPNKNLQPTLFNYKKWLIVIQDIVQSKMKCKKMQVKLQYKNLTFQILIISPLLLILKIKNKLLIKLKIIYILKFKISIFAKKFLLLKIIIKLFKAIIKIQFLLQRKTIK